MIYKQHSQRTECLNSLLSVENIVAFTTVKRDAALTQVMVLYFPAVDGHSYIALKQRFLSLTASLLPTTLRRLLAPHIIIRVLRKIIPVSEC